MQTGPTKVFARLHRQTVLTLKEHVCAPLLQYVSSSVSISISLCLVCLCLCFETCTTVYGRELREAGAMASYRQSALPYNDGSSAKNGKQTKKQKMQNRARNKTLTSNTAETKQKQKKTATTNRANEQAKLYAQPKNLFSYR